MSKKEQKKTSKNHVPSLAAVLGIEPSVQFEFQGSVFEAKPMSLGDQIRLGAALEKDSLEAQAEVLTRLLADRLVDGVELSYDDVLDGIDVPTATQLLRLLQGQRRPTAVDDADGAGGK